MQQMLKSSEDTPKTPQRGLTSNAGTMTLNNNQASEAEADQAVAWLQRSLRSPLDAQAIDEVRAVVSALTVPANPAWLMARVASLLTAYYEKNTPQSVREMEAEDWADALAEYPAWAINKAVRWWKGPLNENRHRRPVEGDISARAAREMDAVSAAKIILRSGVALQATIDHGRERVSKEAAAEILAAAGFAPNKFGGNST